MPEGSHDAADFAVAYVRAIAETCGALAANQCASGEEWAPAEWLDGDSDAVTEAAELMEIDLDGADWTALRRIYEAPTAAAFAACGLAVRTPAPAYAGADITVHVGRDTIDPQGLGSDEECAACEEHILDAVRAAFPGATVRPVNRGGRTSGTTRDGVNLDAEVRAVVTQAFDSFEWTGDDAAGTAEVECAYCGALPSHAPGVPALDDDASWEALAEEHGEECEWIATRAHRLDTRVIVDQDNNAEAWWDAARADAGEQSPAVAALFARIDAATSSVHGVCCRAQDAEALIAWASDLPGWGAGPAHARNPLLVQSA